MSNLDLSLYRSIEALADNDIPNPILRIDFFLHAVITGEECNIEPVTKTEEYLYALATGDESRLEFYDSITLLEEYLEALRTGDTSNLREPRTREEIILYQAITGEDLGVEPVSRIETYLSMLQNAGGLDYILSTSTNASVISLTNSINGKARVQEMCGDTLVNLWDFNKIEKSGQVILSNNKISATTTTNIWSNFFCLNIDSFKPSTIYTIITNVTKNTLSSSDCIYITSDSGGIHKDVFGTNYVIGGGKTGVFKFACTTLSDFTDITSSTRSFISNNSQSVGCEIELSLIILEGDWTNREIPSEYFEGMKSCGETKDNMIDVEVRYDLISNNKVTFKRGNLIVGTGVVETTIGDDFYSDFIEIPYGTKEFRVTYQSGATYCKLVYYDVNKKYIYGDYNRNNNSHSSRVPSGAKYVVTGAFHNSFDSSFVRLYADVGALSTIQLPQPLRGLPNGVQDRIVYLDENTTPIAPEGKGLYLENNVGSKLIDGSLNYNIAKIPGHTKTSRISTIIPNSVTGVGICDKILYLQTDDDFVHCKIGDAPNTLFIYCEDSTQSIKHSHDGKNYMKNNPFTIQYQLQTPTYTKISDVNFECYENATVYVDSGAVAPTKTVIRYPYKQPALFSL